MENAIQYISLAESSGYGLSAQQYMLALQESGAEVVWLPLFDSLRGYKDLVEEEELRYRVSKLRHGYQDSRMFAFNPHSRKSCRALDAGTVLHHTVPELWDFYWEPRKTNIAYTVWETTEIPIGWRVLSERMERILVPSELSKRAFCAARLEEKVRVVPHIDRRIDDNLYAVRYFRERYRIPAHHFVYYTISSWNIRKAPWSTLNCFLQAFTGKDPVTLVIKSDELGDRHYDSIHTGRTRHFVEAIIANYPSPANVVLIDRDIPVDEIDALHTVGDCYVALPHAEGWALGAFEAGSAGNPVVITGWGGQLDYLSPDNAYLVDYTLATVRNKRAPRSYATSQRWAQPDIDDAVDKIRWVYAHADEARRAGAAVQTDIRQRFNADRIAKMLRDAIPE